MLERDEGRPEEQLDFNEKNVDAVNLRDVDAEEAAIIGDEVPWEQGEMAVYPIQALPIVSRTENTKVRASDERSKGGAPVVYFITDNNDNLLDSIRFTNRPVTEGGFNGVTNNDQVIMFLKMALDALDARTRDRQERDVEGKYKA